MTPERAEEIGLEVYDFERKYQDQLIKKQGYPEESPLTSEVIELLRFMKKGGILLEYALKGLAFIDKMSKQTKILVGELEEYLIKDTDDAQRENKSANEEL